MERLTGDELLRDLPLECRAVGTMLIMAFIL